MKDVKFRAWNKFYKKMYEVYRIDFDSSLLFCRLEDGSSYTFGMNDCLLEQYTDQNDEDDNEIYAGDIVFSEQWNPSMYVVVFSEGAFGFGSPKVPDYINSIHYLESFKIIGNIHQNADLLSEDKKPLQKIK